MTTTEQEMLLRNARTLRREMTRQERHLWYDFLRNHPDKFYKQRPIPPYIVDFYCPSAKLVVELDGGQHFEAEGLARDAVRDGALTAHGLRILRFSNLDVDQNFDGVCAAVNLTLHQRRPPP